MKTTFCFLLLAINLAGCLPDSSSRQVEQYEKNFANPPAEYGPETWWHWLNGNISREGITRDLEELKDKGYRGATVFSIGHHIWGHYAKGPVPFMSPEWYDHFQHAVREADRLGLKLMFHNCDGWATSGGPWVTPEDAMKVLVHSEMNITGPVSYHEPLPEPCKTMDFYEDIAIVAYPVKRTDNFFIQQHQPVATASTESRDLQYIFDNNPTSWAVLSGLNTSGEISLTLTFPEPVAVSKLFLYNTRIWGEAQAVRCELFFRDKDGQYRSLLEFDHRQPVSRYEFEETEAKQFKLVFHSFNGWEKYAIQQIIKIQEFQLLPAGTEPILPLISDWDNKAGYSNFRVNGDYLPQEQVEPELIIPAGQQINLTDRFSEGSLQWEVPAGNWKVIRLGYTVTGKPNEPSTDEGRGLECDKLSAESAEKYFAGYPDQIMQKNKVCLGKTLHAMLIDSWEAGNQNWTQDFEAQFQNRRGYSMTPWLLVLSGRIVESVDASERFLWDFRRTIGDLIAENYYGKMAELSNEQGISLQAEAAHVALQFMVDAINYHSMVDIPMNEFWIQPDKIGYNIRPGFTDAASAAHIYDKKIVACESFTCGEGNWRHSPYWLKPAADKVFTMGVNRITFDTYTHQPDERAPGWNLSPWGVAHNRKLTWWEYEKPWIEYLSRCQYLLQMGDPVADFLVFTGEGVPSFLRVQSGSDNGLVPKGYAFDGCNKETLLHRIRVKDGKLILPHGPFYRAVIFPETDKMTPELAAGVARLVRKGATVFGPRPLGSPSLEGYPDCDNQVHKSADLAWGSSRESDERVHNFGRGKTLTGKDPGEMADLLKLKPDFEYRVTTGQASLEYLHRRADNMEIYFISNQDSAKASVICTFRVKHKRPELWLPDMGTIDKEIPFRTLDERTEVNLQMDPYGSAFVVFREELEEPGIKEAADQQEMIIPVELSPDTVIAIQGPWEVEFPDGMGIPGSTRLDKLISWTDHPDVNIMYYSGTAVYRISFKVSEDFTPAASIRLNLGKVREIAKVYINAKEAGILWKPPFEMDVTTYLEPGENTLEVHVVNTWTNRLIGDLSLPEEERHTWVNCCLPLSQESELMESGLLGPVMLYLTTRTPHRPPPVLPSR